MLRTYAICIYPYSGWSGVIRPSFSVARLKWSEVQTSTWLCVEIVTDYLPLLNGHLLRRWINQWFRWKTTITKKSFSADKLYLALFPPFVSLLIIDFSLTKNLYSWVRILFWQFNFTQFILKTLLIPIFLMSKILSNSVTEFLFLR